MDIIDVMLARALTPQGQIESYAAQSQQAVARANEALENIESITEQTNQNSAAAAQALEDAQATLTQVNSALDSLEQSNTEQIQSEIDKLAYSLSKRTTASTIITDMVVSNPSGLATTVEQIDKMYRQTGTNEDGTMTQKAITAALDLKANSADVATKEYVDAKVAGGSGSGVSNLGIDAAGKIVVVGPDGNIVAGDVTEEKIIEALVQSDSYEAEGTAGLMIDYANKSITRSQDSANESSGTFFNKYAMYGGRMRCNVADNGTINAFYGDAGYTEDGSNGQVMLYQPKFYYMRTPIRTSTTLMGKIIQKESIVISDQHMTGFKLHPIFKNSDGEELDYVLLPVYEASLEENKLTSIAGVKPASNINILDAETYAANRGNGWHMTNLAAESVNQMLQIVEYGTMNIQSEIEQGITNITTDTSTNHASVTGSTASIGNGTGAAASTINDGTTYTVAGKRAICYRGMENPYGNIWHMIGGLLIQGNGSTTGSGIPYICNDYNYSSTPGSNYVSIGFNLPANYGWISGMGYGNPDYDWVYLPAECNATANSATPVGDALWAEQSLMSVRCAVIGGSWAVKEQGGMFAYGCDRSITESNRATYGARIMFIPTKNNTYLANINKWKQHYGG